MLYNSSVYNSNNLKTPYQNMLNSLWYMKTKEYFTTEIYPTPFINTAGAGGGGEQVMNV